jgi:hypothetical protein
MRAFFLAVYLFCSVRIVKVRIVRSRYGMSHAIKGFVIFAILFYVVMYAGNWLTGTLGLNMQQGIVMQTITWMIPVGILYFVLTRKKVKSTTGV